MNIQRATPVNELLAKLIFLVLPTGLMGYFLLDHVNVFYSILENQAERQAGYFAAGMVLGSVFYAFRFRFLPTFVILLIGFYSIYKGLDQYASSEMDSFFISLHFQVFAILFTAGWLSGWGFTRLRYWSVGSAVFFLATSIALIAKANAPTVISFLVAFSPAVLYTVYIIFTAEQIYNYKDKSQQFWWFLSRRVLFFGLLALLLFGYVAYRMKAEIKETVANFGGGGTEGKGGMLKENKDGSFDLRDYSRLSSSLSRSKQLLFCAHIDNFFPGTNYPNPLYLTAFYFTKFDTLTETFERDSVIPFNDLFEPDPSKIPLFYTRTDSNVIRNSLGPSLRNTVEVEIYNKMLSPSTYLSPNVGFFVQPIAIEKDFREEFKSAYRTKSYVSVLNSAYFVYNSPNPTIRKFQEQRFEVLRHVTDYSKVDKRFLAYYTYMPGNDKYKNIGELAHRVTDTATTPVDKMIAIRNYFLSKDENGARLYQYTDNPGVPDLPNASKLMHFLNENHRGYCAYFAGATLFMLRSLGIPSRIAVGFLTEDRSDKNKGWYWYYANQAHAWVQVYFPGFGWLDFDTTVGNDNENRPTPQPDGTPPMQPPRAWLAADGIVENVDTLKKRMTLSVKQVVFHDREYRLPSPETIEMDMDVAVVYRDSVAIPISAIQKGDEGTAVSYAEVLKRLAPHPGEGAKEVVGSLPRPTPVDEVYLKRKDTAKPKETAPVAAQARPFPVRQVLITILLAVLGLLTLLFGYPQLVWWYYLLRYRGADASGRKVYWANRAAFYYVHMCGYFRGNRTPMQFAREMIDPELGTRLEAFTTIYLKKKFAGQELNLAEQRFVTAFLAEFVGQVRKRTQWRRRAAGFVNPVRCAGFFMATTAEDIA